MTPEELKKATETLLHSGLPENVGIEQAVGIKLSKKVYKLLGASPLIQWMSSEEWEDVLLPTRLPKGMHELLEAADSARTEHISTGRCEECEEGVDCLFKSRNPSEILITVLLKLAFAGMFARELK